MKEDKTTVSIDMKQLFSAFIDCYRALEFIATKKESGDEIDLEMVRRVDEKGADIAAKAMESATDTPSESIFALAIAVADIAVNVSNVMFHAEAMMSMEEDE